MTSDGPVDWRQLRVGLPEDGSAGRKIQTDCIGSERREVG
jgi:hypothetical protein